MTTLERFWSKVDVRSDDECWPWMGSRDRAGYGLFYFEHRRRTRSHRWILGHLRDAALSREVVGAEDACHRCDNPPCCNPAHLYVGTRSENMREAADRRRLWMQANDTCPQGHAYTWRTGRGDRPRRRCRTCENAAARKARAA